MIANILTLEEVVQIGRGPIWLQENWSSFCQIVMYDAEHIPYLKFKICTTRDWNRHLKYLTAEYGKTWRCFDVKPSVRDLSLPFEEG